MTNNQNVKYEMGIGSLFRHEGKLLECVESQERFNCPKCFFHALGCNSCLCDADERQDGKDVFFREVDKEKLEKEMEEKHEKYLRFTEDRYFAACADKYPLTSQNEAFYMLCKYAYHDCIALDYKYKLLTGKEYKNNKEEETANEIQNNQTGYSY